MAPLQESNSEPDSVRLPKRNVKVFSYLQLEVVWDPIVEVVVKAMVQPEVVVPMVKVEVEPVVKVAELPLLVGTAQKST